MKDPYKYYRIEARELLDGITQGVLAIEKGAADGVLVQKLLRLAHTLKGASRVVKLSETAERAHRIEDLLGPFREGGAAPREVTEEVLKLVDGMSRELDGIGGGASPAAVAAAPAADTPAPRDGFGETIGRERRPASLSSEKPAARVRSEGATAGDERFQSVRVDIAEMDAVLEGVAQMGVQLAALRKPADEVEHARMLLADLANSLTARVTDRDRVAALARARALTEQLVGMVERAGRVLGSVLDRSEAELRQVRDRANLLRLLPASTVFAKLERAVRDVAALQGKAIAFVTVGGEQRLDGHMLAPLSDALLHVVRNAADHGIETDQERIIAGKATEGRIELAVERRGQRVVFRASDDGRGLNVDVIRAALLKAGKIAASEAAALDLDGAIKLLLQGGVSTAARVTEISGRGLGMSILQETATRLKGELAIRSTPGRGTTIELAVPASLTAQSSLVVEAGGIPSSLPLDAVRRTLRVALAEIARAPRGRSIVYEGQAIPFVPLAELFGVTGEDDAERSGWTTVVVEARNGSAAIGVDRLVGQADVVARPLPATLGAIPMVTGCAFTAEGDPQPVLDAEGLVATVHGHTAPEATRAARAKPKILVVDDSLTTRMLEQSILESEGYEVTLASSGEEGLAKAREQRFNLILCDIEMPGMNGFEFITATQADSALRDVPTMLVSSYSDPFAKKRGAEVGARAYIVKGEFEQGKFMDTVRSLAG